MKNLVIVNNNLIKTELTILRDKKTNNKDFRIAADKLCNYLLIDSLSDINVVKRTVETPVGKTDGFYTRSNVVFIPIIRAGLSMLSPALKIINDAKIGFAGIQRDERSAKPVENYWKIPEVSLKDTIIILDPMLATGGSAGSVIEKLNKLKPREIRLITVISAPEGVDYINKNFPNVKVYTGDLDQKLNTSKFIIPGLGDFGDRYFGTD